MHPDISAVIGDENWDIPDDADTLFMCIFLNRIPLLEEDELGEGMLGDLLGMRLL